METRGRHLIVELDGCDSRILSDPARIRRAMLDAAERAQATPLSDDFHVFPNGGVSGVVLLAESHISIHTWPEHRYAAVDVYTCGHRAMPQTACMVLRRGLRARSLKVTTLDRGISCADGTHQSLVQEALEVPLRTAS